MKRRFRFRWLLKWMFTVACALFAVAFISSRWWYAGCKFPVGGRYVYVELLRGTLMISSDNPPFARDDPGSWRAVTRAENVRGPASWGGFNLFPSPLFCDYGHAWWFMISLWVPSLFCLVVAALLWRLDRRRARPGHCTCGYNLTGNTSGRCPECGAATGRAT